MEAFRVIIAGSRDCNDYDLVRDEMEKILIRKAKTHEIIIISGGARGADALGEQYAEEKGYECEIYEADWNKYGKSAGYRRNQQMAEVANACVVFWDGVSRGSKHMADIAKEKGLMLRVIKY